jgi:integrase
VTSLLPSRTPPLARIPTLADVIQRVRNDESLPARRRQDMVSACKTACRVAGHDPAAIPADPVLLRRLLAEASYRAAGISIRRWNNIRSLFGHAVRQGVPVAASRRTRELTPEWTALRKLLKARFPEGRPSSVETGLSSLMHFASERGLSPGAVDQSTFDEYRVDLRSSLRKNPERTYYLAFLAWNNAVDTVPGWPKFKLPRCARKGAWTLPWSSFPASLYEEVVAWFRRLSGNDLFDFDELPLRPLRPSTVAQHEYQFRLAASALVRQGRDPQSIRGLADLTTLEAFKLILRYMIDRREGIPGGQVAHIAKLLQSTARHKFNAPNEQLDAMGGVIRRARKKLQTGMTRVNRDRLRGFDDPAAVQTLVRLPKTLMAAARRASRPRDAAMLARAALAIELLLMTAMRIGNVADLDLERHIARTSKGKRVWITREGHEVKNGPVLEFPLPAPTIALLDTYLQEYRGRFVTCETTALFPGRGDKPRNSNGFGQHITKTIKAYTGLTINPHLFRHLGAKLYLEANPGAYEVVRLVLGHKNISTTTGFYTGTETAAAIRHFHQVILSRKEEGPPR